MKMVLRTLESGRAGVLWLIQLAEQIKECYFDEVDLDLRCTTWIDANMCAPLGALLYRASRQANNVTVMTAPGRVETILSKNRFLRSYGHQAVDDTYATTIGYERFESKDDRYFGNYIETGLVGKGLPRMTPSLLRRFRESIFEIFSNAVIHARSEFGIFSCGQFYPKKNRLDFTIADLGIGFRQNLQANVGLDLAAEQAIAWAMEGTNTTKKGPIPGGLGLKLLREFVTFNGGSIQITSDRGYWQLSNGQVSTTGLP